MLSPYWQLHSLDTLATGNMLLRQAIHTDQWQPVTVSSDQWEAARGGSHHCILITGTTTLKRKYHLVTGELIRDTHKTKWPYRLFCLSQFVMNEKRLWERYSFPWIIHTNEGGKEDLIEMLMYSQTWLIDWSIRLTFIHNSQEGGDWLWQKQLSRVLCKLQDIREQPQNQVFQIQMRPNWPPHLYAESTHHREPVVKH